MITQSGQVHVLGLGTEEPITYVLRHTNRRQTVGIFVDSDGQVEILAPNKISTNRVEQIIRRRIKWIRRKQRIVASLPRPSQPREWVAGETHRYLGRQYRLKLVVGDPCSVKLIGGYFVVTLPDAKNRACVRDLMNFWYREHAVSLLNDRVGKAICSTSWLEMGAPVVRVQCLKTRWGSTTAAGRITFNTDLVKLSLSCVDYVVMHELVHLMIPNHSPAFWRMLGRVMPDWRRWQARLATAEF